LSFPGIPLFPPRNTSFPVGDFPSYWKVPLFWTPLFFSTILFLSSRSPKLQFCDPPPVPPGRWAPCRFLLSPHCCTLEFPTKTLFPVDRTLFQLWLFFLFFPDGTVPAPPPIPPLTQPFTLSTHNQVQRPPKIPFYFFSKIAFFPGCFFFIRQQFPPPPRLFPLGPSPPL